MTFRFLTKLTLTVLVSMATACKIDSDSFGFNGHGMGIARAANAFGVRTVGVSELDLPDRPLTFYPRPSELATTQSFTHGIHTRNVLNLKTFTVAQSTPANVGRGDVTTFQHPI
jgi:hypothetical protein